MATQPDRRRKGDPRTFVHDPSKRLKLWPMRGYPFRWKPEHGEPECVGETVSHYVWRHKLAFYTALIVSLSFLVQALDLLNWVGA
jgi:hypothetical protein